MRAAAAIAGARSSQTTSAASSDATTRLSDSTLDLVYVFAVTQLSHQILADLSVVGVLRAAFLLLVVWWAWIYTTWMANLKKSSTAVVDCVA
jgi:low temperature requirement protein LtrA